MSGYTSPMCFWPFALLTWTAIGSPQPRRVLQHGAAQGRGQNCSWDASCYAKSGTIPTLHKNSEPQLSVNPRMLIAQRCSLAGVIRREGYGACTGWAVQHLHALTTIAHMGILHSCTTEGGTGNPRKHSALQMLLKYHPTSSVCKRPDRGMWPCREKSNIPLHHLGSVLRCICLFLQRK